jgi:hypothetical protein
MGTFRGAASLGCGVLTDACERDREPAGDPCQQASDAEFRETFNIWNPPSYFAAPGKVALQKLDRRAPCLATHSSKFAYADTYVRGLI